MLLNQSLSQEDQLSYGIRFDVDTHGAKSEFVHQQPTKLPKKVPSFKDLWKVALKRHQAQHRINALWKVQKRAQLVNNVNVLCNGLKWLSISCSKDDEGSSTDRKMLKIRSMVPTRTYRYIQQLCQHNDGIYLLWEELYDCTATLPSGYRWRANEQKPTPGRPALIPLIPNIPLNDIWCGQQPTFPTVVGYIGYTHIRGGKRLCPLLTSSRCTRIS